jgi:hypothetical protein
MVGLRSRQDFCRYELRADLLSARWKKSQLFNSWFAIAFSGQFSSILAK